MAVANDVIHAKAKSLAWDSDRRRSAYPTRYKLPGKTKDPFRHLLGEYYAMERAKDDRLYGLLTDAQMSAGTRATGNSRWMEILKPFLGFTVNAEYMAMKSMAMLIDAVPNAELRQGYLAQMLDELRHVNVQNHLLRYFAKTAPDPAGFNTSHRFRASHPILGAGRALFETFLSDDPVACALGLQVITETAYTNPLFVATTEIAAANDDQITPSAFLSIQSDEARHMANGYATLAAVLSSPENIPLVREDLELCFWRQHAFFDPFLTLVYDYSSAARSRSYGEYWEEWIWEEWVGAYMDRLAPLGITRPASAELARANVRWLGHDLAVLAAAIWPVNFWRQEPLTNADYEWFEDKYPGWWNRYGAFWQRFAECVDPANGGLPVDLLGELPFICRVCQMPIHHGQGSSLELKLVRDATGRRHAFCSGLCESFFRAESHRYTAPTWTEINDGVELSEYVLREGLVRTDGVTLVPQPQLSIESDRLWSVADVERLGVEIRDPLAQVPESQFSQLP
jgi:methane monooxygenase component A alpha chain